jgi:hypothetical protein
LMSKLRSCGKDIDVGTLYRIEPFASGVSR